MENNLGYKIKKIRERKGFVQEYVAKKLNVPQEQYSYIENRQKQIPDETLELLAKIFEMSKEEIVNFQPDNTINNNFTDYSTGYFNITNLIVESHQHERNAYKELIAELKNEILELKKGK